MGLIALVVEPDPEESECGLPFLDVRIDGRTYPFVLDTGARTSVLQADEYTITLPEVGIDHSSGLFESRETVVVEVGSVEFGDVRHEHVPMSLTDPEDTEAGSLLGMDVLGSHALRLDLRGESLEIIAPGPGGEPLRRDAAGHCFVPVTWPSRTANACIDTGAAITVASRQFFDAHPEFFRAGRISIGRGNGGIEVETPTYELAGYAIGDVSFAAHVVAVVELPDGATGTDLILGYPTLVQARWTLDLVHNTWSVEA